MNMRKQEGEYIQPDFDFERLKRAVECDSVEIPSGISSAEELDAWLCGLDEKQEGLNK